MNLRCFRLVWSIQDNARRHRSNVLDVRTWLFHECKGLTQGGTGFESPTHERPRGNGNALSLAEPAACPQRSHWASRAQRLPAGDRKHLRFFPRGCPVPIDPRWRGDRHLLHRVRTRRHTRLGSLCPDDRPRQPCCPAAAVHRDRHRDDVVADPRQRVWRHGGGLLALRRNQRFGVPALQRLSSGADRLSDRARNDALFDACRCRAVGRGNGGRQPRRLARGFHFALLAALRHAADTVPLPRAFGLALSPLEARRRKGGARGLGNSRKPSQYRRHHAGVFDSSSAFNRTFPEYRYAMRRRIYGLQHLYRQFSRRAGASQILRADERRPGPTR